MASVERILPRFWDGRRLLRFVTGLALIALAFAVQFGGPGQLDGSGQFDGPGPATVAAAPVADGAVEASAPIGAEPSVVDPTEPAGDVAAPTAAAAVAARDDAVDVAATTAATVDVAAPVVAEAVFGFAVSVRGAVAIEGAQAPTAGSTPPTYGARAPPSR